MAGTVSLETYDEGTFFRHKITFTFASGDTGEVTKNIIFEGELREIISIMGSTGGANPTGTVAIDDLDGNEVYSAAGLVEGSTTKHTMSESLPGTITVGLVPSTNPLGAWVSYVYLKGVK